jgi:hypothetical protein
MDLPRRAVWQVLRLRCAPLRRTNFILNERGQQQEQRQQQQKKQILRFAKDDNLKKKDDDLRKQTREFEGGSITR